MAGRRKALNVSAKVDPSEILSRLKDAERFTEGFGKYYEAMCNDIGANLQSAVRERIRKQGHVRTGRLIESIQHKRVGKRVSVFADARYYTGVEDGKKIHYYAPWVEEGVDKVITPKTSGRLVFYSRGRWYSKKSVKGQKPAHFMLETKQDADVQRQTEQIVEMYANLALADALSAYSSQYRNAKGNRRGWNMTRRGRELTRRR